MTWARQVGFPCRAVCEIGVPAVGSLSSLDRSEASGLLGAEQSDLISPDRGLTRRETSRRRGCRAVGRGTSSA